MSYSVSDTIQLRPVTISDAKELFHLVDTNRAHLSEWLAWVGSTQTVKDTEGFLQSVTGQHAGETVFAIIFKRRLAGLISWRYVERVTKRVSLGYWMAAKFQGHGIMGACVNFLTAELFDHQNVTSVEIQADTKNMKSRAVAERCQFRHCGTLEKYAYLNGGFRDHAFYILTKEDWKHSKQQEKQQS